MRCQLSDQPIRQRFCRVLIIFFGIRSAASHRDDRALDGRTSRLPLDRLCIGALPDIRIGCRHVVLRPDVTPIRREAAFGIDADEDASADDLGRIVNHRPVFERDQCRLDFAETLIDLSGQLVGILIIGFKLGLLGVECVDGGLLLWGEIDRFALQLTQPLPSS